MGISLPIKLVTSMPPYNTLVCSLTQNIMDYSVHSGQGYAHTGQSAVIQNDQQHNPYTYSIYSTLHTYVNSLSIMVICKSTSLQSLVSCIPFPQAAISYAIQLLYILLEYYDTLTSGRTGWTIVGYRHGDTPLDMINC